MRNQPSYSEQSEESRPLTKGTIHPTLMGAESLRRQAARAGVHLILYRVAGFGWSFITLAYLICLVGAESYGAYAAAAAVLNFFSTLGAQGGRMYLVRQPEGVERRLIDTTFWWLLGLSLCVGLGLLCVGLALLLSGAPSARFGGALSALALILPLMAARCVPMALLERDLDYPRLARAELSRQLIFGAAGVGLAWQGGGVWAFVLAHWLGEAGQAVALFWGARYRPVWGWNRALARQSMQESFTMSAGAWLYELRSLGPTLALMPLAGERAVGYYAFAERLMSGLSLGSGAIAQLSTPIYAKLQNHPDALLRALYRSAQAQLLMLGGLALIAMILAPLLLPSMMGVHGYHPVILLTLAVLCINALWMSISGAQAQALYVRRQARFMLGVNLLFVVVMFPATALGVWLTPAPYQAAGYALGYTLAYLPNRWLLHRATCRWIGKPIYGMNFLWTLGLSATLFAPLTGYWALLGLVVFLHPASRRELREVFTFLREARASRPVNFPP